MNLEVLGIIIYQGVHYLQGSNRDTDIENRLTDMGRRKESAGQMEGISWKHIYHMYDR